MKKEREFAMKKRIVCLLISVCLLLSGLCTGVLAAAPEQVAEELCAIDVFRGTGGAKGFDLDRAPTRREAAVMLVRLYGAEDEAMRLYAAGAITHPFADGKDWSAPYIAWLYSRGMTKGVSETSFGADRPCSARDYAVFLLRSLGYQDNFDFTYAQAEQFAAEAGFYDSRLFCGEFLRGDMALMTYFALASKTADGKKTLLDALVDSGSIEKDAARPMQTAFKGERAVTFGANGMVLNETRWRQQAKELEIRVVIDNGSSVLPSGVELLTTEFFDRLLVSDGRGGLVIQDAVLNQMLSAWEQKYNVQNVPYQFDSYVKGLTSIEFIKRNYAVDRERITKQLMQQLFLMQSATIEAPLYCYDWTGARFSIEKTHVEVDIDNQQLTFIKNGEVIVNTNIVTGAINGHQTPVGLYSAHGKETNATLTGEDYEVFVKYWVSVIGDSVGLHDASWRSNFGSDYYVYGGSHGCINIPEWAMVKIFFNIDEGTPVLIHGKNQWYEPFSGNSPATVNPARGTTAKTN